MFVVCGGQWIPYYRMAVIFNDKISTIQINPFPNVARYILHETFIFHLVMSLPAMTFGDRFCFSRKGGIDGRGWVHTKGADNMAINEEKGYLLPTLARKNNFADVSTECSSHHQGESEEGANKHYYL